MIREDGIVVGESFQPVIITYTGKYIQLKNPDPEMICLQDIVNPLSNICRFTGHCKRFYSVAQHSVEVQNLVPDNLKLAALFHDAAEAYLGDISRPLKSLIPEYKVLETSFLEIIFKAFSIPWPSAKEWGLIKQADNQMLSSEAYWLCNVEHPEIDWDLDLKPTKIFPVCLYPTEASQEFIQIFRELGGELINV